MKVFLDTSVLVAAFYADHEHHASSLDLFLRVSRKGGCCGAHSLAEVYATVTGMPVPRRTSPSEALLFLKDIRERLTLIALNELEYSEMIESSVASNLTGGAIYDAILGHCALKAKAEIIYTWNEKDYSRLLPAIAARVRKPGE